MSSSIHRADSPRCPMGLSERGLFLGPRRLCPAKPLTPFSEVLSRRSILCPRRGVLPKGSAPLPYLAFRVTLRRWRALP